MRHAFIAAFAMCACQPAAPLNTITNAPVSPSVSQLQPEADPPALRLNSPAVEAPAFARKTIRGIRFEGVTFDSRSHRLRVIDQPMGPGTMYHSAQAATRKYDALLALNAGFFTPEGKPLGMVVAAGGRAGAWNSSSSLGSGIFSESDSGQLSITRRGSPTTFQSARELIQAGPLLVENGAGVVGLDAEKSAVRSILLTDGEARWWIGTSSLCTLSALGEALASDSPAPWPIRNAINLDGGRSTDLFVSSQIPGGPFERRGILNRPVRNFLILVPR
jgi:hypothetical protein